MARLRVIRWFSESNRWKHLVCGFVIGLFFGFWAAAAAGGACEFKDKAWGGQWDWIDLALTAVGGLLGWLLRWLLFCVII